MWRSAAEYQIGNAGSDDYRFHATALSATGFGSQPRNKETCVPAMLFEGFPKLRGQHGFFFPRLDPIAQDDQANSHDASARVNRHISLDRGQIYSRSNAG